MTFGNSLLGYMIILYLKYLISQVAERNLRNGIYVVKGDQQYKKKKNKLCLCSPVYAYSLQPK